MFGSHFTGSLWETRWPESGRGAYVTLPKKHWRYFVIEMSCEIESLDVLEQAISIARCDLDLGLIALKVTARKLTLPTYVYRPPQLFQSLSALRNAHDSKDGISKTISKADGEHISDIYARIKSHDHSVLDLHSPFRQLLELKDLPHFSPLQILGYFAILESILTHQPAPEDRYDSITRQITRKLALLNKRWQPSLNYSDFGSATHEKIWSKMYAYRSAIAHGASETGL